VRRKLVSRIGICISKYYCKNINIYVYAKYSCITEISSAVCSEFFKKYVINYNYLLAKSCANTCLRTNPNSVITRVSIKHIKSFLLFVIIYNNMIIIFTIITAVTDCYRLAVAPFFS
jgi:hypothetical protein